MSLTEKDGTLGGWSLPQRSHSQCSMEHFNGVRAKQEPYFLRLRKALPWWEKHAPRDTLALIQEGVQPSFPLPVFLESKKQVKSAQEEAQALQVLEEYMEVGAVIKDPPGPTKHLVPWFVISKQEQGKEKLRLISDCRIINQFFDPKHFKLDHWKNIFPFLKKGMWAGKVDLKHAYFHLGLADQLKNYRTGGPTGTVAPEPGIFPMRVELLVLNILFLKSPLCSCSPLFLFVLCC